MAGGAWLSHRLRRAGPRSAGCLRILESPGPSEGAAGKRNADITSGQLDVWKWTPGRGGCGELGFSRTIINGSCI